MVLHEEVSDFNGFEISCNGEDNGYINIAVTGGTEDYLYEWTLDGVPYSDLDDISDLGPGVYNLTVTDTNGCSIPGSYIIEEDTAIEVDLAAIDGSSDYNGFG